MHEAKKERRGRKREKKKFRDKKERGTGRMRRRRKKRDGDKKEEGEGRIEVTGSKFRPEETHEGRAFRVMNFELCSFHTEYTRTLLAQRRGASLALFFPSSYTSSPSGFPRLLTLPERDPFFILFSGLFFSFFSRCLIC